MSKGTLRLVHLRPCALGSSLDLKDGTIHRLIPVKAQGSGDHRGGGAAAPVAVGHRPLVPSTEEPFGAGR